MPGRNARVVGPLVAVVACGLLAGVAGAADKSGVTPNAISLPTGPGSIEGLGESFQPNLNTGTAKYAVTLEVPPGTAGHTPSLALRYDAGGGNGPVGFGWRLAVAFVQRQTDKGIPRYVDGANGVDDDRDGELDEYDELDRFINGASEELVPTADGYWRSENEGAFVRYRRVGDHWEANRPDGSLLEFGVSNEGRIVDEATGRVFRWLLERSTDTHGNQIVYRYRGFAGDDDLSQRYLWKVEYGPGAPPWSARHFAVFEYETRSDWFEDARAGFLVRTGRRLASIAIGTQGVQLGSHAAGDFDGDGTSDFLNRRYRLAYDAHPHWSLLTSVTVVGADDVSTLPPMVLAYTVADPPDSLQASTATIGAVNAPIQAMDSELVDLVDLNGDALPDLLRTEGAGGPHTVYYNQGEVDDDGAPAIAWTAGQQVAGDALAGNVNLAATSGAVAHLADMNADGLADLVYEAAATVYYFANDGSGGWGTRTVMNVDPGDSAPPSPYRVANVKTADLDFDKRMDIIQSVAAGLGADYRIWFNLGAQRWARSTTVPQEAGRMLSDPGVHVADWNGDRVPDVVRVRPTGIDVTVGLGHGRFAANVFVPLPDYTLTSAQAAGAQLEDITGDGLCDLVIDSAGPSQLWYWINLGNHTVDRRRIVTGMPTGVSPNPGIRWADLNGNGSIDYVYADSNTNPRIQTVDLGRLLGYVPSPNLLVRIENGIGRVTTIEYGTSTRYVLDDAASERPWPNALPFALNVVSRVRVDDSLGNESVSELTYHDGYYDGEEKEFRGFGAVEQRDMGDSTGPDLVLAYHFETGADEEALKGKALQVEARDAEGGVFYRETQHWRARTLAESATGEGREVKIAIRESRQRDVLERGNGTPVSVRWEFEYDDYGNLTRQLEHGRLDTGWGDERVSNSTFTAAYVSGREAWILNRIVESSVRTLDGEVASHTRNYYDGSQVLGTVERGDLSRSERWVAGDHWISAVRQEFDTHGNVVEIADPLFDEGSDHFRSIGYDDALRSYPVSETVHSGAVELVFEAGYDEGFGRVVWSRDYAGAESHYAYDAFGRIVSHRRPLEADPSIEWDYVLASDLGADRRINWIETRKRDGRPPDGFLRSRRFFDGRGRQVMVRRESDDPSQVLVEGARRLSARGFEVERYLPYHEQGGLAYRDPASETPSLSIVCDALGREVETRQPELGGTRSATRVEYAPLFREVHDEEDLRAGSPHFGTPHRLLYDALGYDSGGRLRELHQLVRMDDVGNPAADLAVWPTRYEYDLLDKPVRIVDAQNNVRVFSYDGLGRLTSVRDPDRGRSSYGYDDASNLVERIDSAGRRTTWAYDGANRLIEEDDEDEALDFSSQRTPDVRYHYDVAPEGVAFGDGSTRDPAHAAGRLTWVDDWSGQEIYSYDARGRVEWSVKRIRNPDTGLWLDFGTETAYDALDRPVALRYPDGDRVEYRYGDRGLLSEVVAPMHARPLLRIEYTPGSDASRVEFGNGVVTTRSFDARLRLHTLVTAPESRPEAPMLAYRYEYDEVSNPTVISDLRPGLAPDDARRNTRSFQYDDLYRLMFTSYGGETGEDSWLSYRYDRVGNMLAKRSNVDHRDPGGRPLTDLGAMQHGGVAGSWGRGERAPADPPGPKAVTAIGDAGERSILYDAVGNVTELDGRTHTWDFRDRLAVLEGPSGRVDYVYDWQGNRVIRSSEQGDALYPSRDFELRKGQPVKYVLLDGGRVVRATGTLDASVDRVQRLALDVGWNLVSVGVRSELPATPELEQGFRWRPAESGWESVSPGAPLGVGDVLWLRCSAPAVATLVGPSEPYEAAARIDGFRGSALHELPIGPLPEQTALWLYDDGADQWRPHLADELTGLSDAPGVLRAGAVAFVDAPGGEHSDPLAPPSSGLLYLHGDHMGSLELITNAEGVVHVERHYYPFGAERMRVGAGAPSLGYGFVDREHDDESGYVHIGARYYEPSLGRFLSVEPLVAEPQRALGSPMRAHAYAYAQGRPLVLLDADGKKELTPEQKKLMEHDARMKKLPPDVARRLRIIDNSFNIAEVKRTLREAGGSKKVGSGTIRLRTVNGQDTLEFVETTTSEDKVEATGKASITELVAVDARGVEVDQARSTSSGDVQPIEEAKLRDAVREFAESVITEPPPENPAPAQFKLVIGPVIIHPNQQPQPSDAGSETFGRTHPDYPEQTDPTFQIRYGECIAVCEE